MGGRYRESLQPSGGAKPLFDSLKRVWLTSLTRPDALGDRAAPGLLGTDGAAAVPDVTVVSRPPPARVLP